MEILLCIKVKLFKYQFPPPVNIGPFIKSKIGKSGVPFIPFDVLRDPAILLAFLTDHFYRDILVKIIVENEIGRQDIVCGSIPFTNSDPVLATTSPVLLTVAFAFSLAQLQDAQTTTNSRYTYFMENKIRKFPNVS